MRIAEPSLRWALTSLARFGDTDLFPRPVELEALSADVDTTVARLTAVDLSGYVPGVARRFIVPKDDLSYRQATQLDPLDSVLLTALFWELGQAIEARRRPVAEQSVFSYRFHPSANGELYSGTSAWNDFWVHCHEESEESPIVLVADIADFYNQIYHHTIENQLAESGWPNQAIRSVMSLLRSTSAEVSRGIPIGPHWTHLLAEASLIPVDNSLSARGLHYSRFVDDIVIFTDTEEAAREAVYGLADVLDKQQRLHLQNAKTQILSAREFQTVCRRMIEDRPINDLERLMVAVIRKHSQGNPYRTVLLSDLSEDDLRAFSAPAVEKVLADYLAARPPDFIRLRWFLRRLAQVGHPAAVQFCLGNFERLLPAIADLCHYLVSVAESGQEMGWADIGDVLLHALDTPVVRANDYFQLSLLGLFPRVAQLDHLPRLIAAYGNASPIVRREIILAAEAAGAGDWLREQKEHFASMDPWSRRAFVYASRRLPREERRFFLGGLRDLGTLDDLIVRHARGWE